LAVLENLHQGDRRLSANGSYELVLQGDGNLVLYEIHVDGSRDVMWVPAKGRNSPAVVASMQGDGNFVLYEQEPATVSGALWATDTWTSPGASLLLQNDGNLVLYLNGTPLWASQSDGGCQRVCYPCAYHCPSAVHMPPAYAVVSRSLARPGVHHGTVGARAEANASGVPRQARSPDVVHLVT
jgi:hypothetical protein